MGFYAPAQLVGDARQHGVEVFAADVNFSTWDCTLEQPAEPPDGVEESKSQSVTSATFALRLGLRMIKGLSESIANRIIEARDDRLFRSVDDFARRTGLTTSALARLARADAFRSLGLDRRNALWQSLPEQKTFSLFDEVHADEPALPLPALTPLEEVVADYRTNGLSLRDHPVKFMRDRLKELRALSSRELAAIPHGKHVRVAGLVLMRQRPATASGITFVTLEDETGIVNLIVRPEIWERQHRIARRSQALLARGTVQRRDQVIHVFVEQMHDLSALLAGAHVKSRDFR
jgi:error-prone DNA polymerase